MPAPRIVVVDYGIGNVFSVCQAVLHAGGDPQLTGDKDKILRADRLILPGVGAFGRAADELRGRGLIEPLRAYQATGRPLLGICVGMQLMLDTSTELGEHQGLGFIPGIVDRVPNVTPDGIKLRVPHVGWSEILLPAGKAMHAWTNTVLGGVRPDRSALYFVHSYAARPRDAADVLAEVDYGGNRLVAAVSSENVTGVQFHPERSSEAGQRILEKFMKA